MRAPFENAHLLLFDSCASQPPLVAASPENIPDEKQFMQPASSWSTTTWYTPTPEPALANASIGEMSHIAGGLPIGNGDTAGILFPVTKAFNTTPSFHLEAGVHLMLSMATAMASDSALMPLGVVSISTDPPLGVSSFRQSLHLTNATAEVRTSVGVISAWVDAESNRAVVSVRSANATSPFRAVNVTVQSLRPSRRFGYAGRCGTPTAAPDVWSQPAGSDSIALSHRNEDDDLVGNFGPRHPASPAYFNSTLRQQGLASLIPALQSSDRWRHRTFGLVVSARGLEVDAEGPFGQTKPNGAHGEYRRARLRSTGALSATHITITTLSEQAPTQVEWEAHAAARHRAHVRQSAGVDSRALHDAYWQRFWERSHIWVGSSRSGASPPPSPPQSSLASALANLTRRYAQTRYVQAIQAGTWVPIKFNGGLFTSQLPPETNRSGPSYRAFGAANWWQNMRLAYWSMLAPADVVPLTGLFEYYLQMVPFLAARTPTVFNHTGIYTTETATLFGAYDPCDYGDAADVRNTTRLPIGYEENRFLRFDFGGDAGLTELAMMLLDVYLYTLDDALITRFLPLLAGTLDFFARHYGDVAGAAQGKRPTSRRLRIFPTQALETYQCWLPSTEDNCPLNDHPTVAALHVLTERALELPARLTTSAQRTQWTRLRDALPPVPIVIEDGVEVVAPFEQYPRGANLGNSETPELYSVHPFRYFSVGRALLPGVRRRSLAPSLHCLESSNRTSCVNSRLNAGWTQLPMNAALLGRAALAARAVLERAATPPATGYRFDGFAPREQDYMPSEDHWANMMTAVQLMLLAPADDGLMAGGALLFPSWPCAWDVDFKVAAPHNTVVSGRLVGGELQSLVVKPPERRAAITVLKCQA